MNLKSVLITTEHRGVFFGQVDEDADLSGPVIKDIKNAIMAIRWGTENGVMQLANTGPTKSSKLSEPADIESLQAVTAVFIVKPEAEAQWLKNL